MTTTIPQEKHARDEKKTAILLAAIRYLREAFSVFPLEHGSKRPAIINGRRFSWQMFQKRRPTEEELRELFQENVGIAVICGKISNGLVVLDFDGKDCAEISARFEEAWPEIAYRTRRVMTGSGKLHIWLRCPDMPEELTRLEWKFPDIGDAAAELRANGHYVVAPPSLHPSGRHYQFLNDKPVLEIPFRKLREIINWFDKYGVRTVGKQNIEQRRDIIRRVEADVPMTPFIKQQNIIFQEP